MAFVLSLLSLEIFVVNLKVVIHLTHYLIFLNFFSSIITRLIEAKFHVEPPWNGGTKASSNGPGHLTKLAAMPIYGKNL